MTKFRFTLILTTLLVFNSLNLCQTDNDYYLLKTRPIKYLPSSVPKKDGQAYLWADTNKIKGNEITVYIINNTDEILHYDGYQLATIQQEYKDIFKKWQRSKSFFYGWCGTPYYYDITIHPGEFYNSLETLVTGNKKYEIRYTFYGSEVESSNIILGSIDTNEPEIAKYDDIAYEYCDADYLIKVIREMPKPFKEVPQRYKEILKRFKDPNIFLESLNQSIINAAIEKLGDRFPKKAIEVLEQIVNNKSHPYNSSALRVINYIKSNNK